MGAYPVHITAWENAFCLSIMWLEHYYKDSVFVVEADYETGQLLLLGNAQVCTDFNNRCLKMCNQIRDPLEEWRYAQEKV